MMEYWVTQSSNPLPQHSITQSSVLHSHNIVTRIHVDHFAGDSAAPVAAQIERGFTHFLGVDISFERRPFANVMEHIFETGNPCSRKRPDGSGGDSVNANAFGPQIMRKKAHARLQCGFRDP